MFQPSGGGGNLPASFNLPSFNQESVRHLLIGDYGAIAGTIHRLERLGYCDRLAWSEPLPTGRGGEYISVMTRRRT